MSDSLGQMNHNLEGLKSDLNEVTKGRDCLDSEVLVLKEQLEMAQAVAEENEAIAIEARQMAEARKNYAEEEEVKLLEKSVEELEYTINGELVKGEAERQRLQREELEGDPTETVHVEGYVAVHVHLYLVLKTLNRPLIVLLILC
ncbi:kinesin-like protein KIN-12F isoform X3 [Magnolia sinica]|uniref:kinesin-like protein KIN-12F isoform X3 n=1 Tax=Magnolia sinica TaxID=86752 RepID=UPI002658CBAE|nr:kinesin-like protein KIN-12F isoform X3 [Magnolia sinica]